MSSLSSSSEPRTNGIREVGGGKEDGKERNGAGGGGERGEAFCNNKNTAVAPYAEGNEETLTVLYTVLVLKNSSVPTLHSMYFDVLVSIVLFLCS